VFAEFVVFYGASCQTGNCPNAQKSPVTTVQVVEAPIYRPNPLAGLLRKKRAVPVIVIVPSESKTEGGK
jgi:hypothetical protein